MSRYVTIAYITPVYATVDLDAEPDADGSYNEAAVPQVQHGDSDVMRLDNLEGVDFLIRQPVIGVSYFGDKDENVDPDSLSFEDRDKALAIAENTLWPAWEGY
jgi:hypothetical protein